MSEINVCLVDLPVSVRGFVRENPDLSYTIVLNARLSRENLMRVYRHELRHIRRNDFDRPETADHIEGG